MGRLMMLDERLGILEEGIVRARRILDGYPVNAIFTSGDYIKFYDCVYFMCIHQDPYDHSELLYQRFQRALEESISSRVLPSLQDKDGASLLMDLKNMWANYKAMAKCLGGFFLYLDRPYKTGAPLSDVLVRVFRELICNAHYEKFLNAAISLINQDRTENPIDRSLLQNVVTFFVEMGIGKNTYYYDNFEKTILADAANFYSRLSSELLVCYSSADYIKKAEWCCNNEIQRVGQYLYQTSVERLLQVLQWHLIGRMASKLIEKQKAENHDSATYQELLSRCASLNLGDGTSALPSQESPMSQ